MITYHAIARVGTGGRVQIQGLGPSHSYPGVHSVRVPVNEKMELVVWWPHRIDPALELTAAKNYAETLRDSFKE